MLAHVAETFAPDWDTKTPQPRVETSAKFDVTGIRPERLGLQIEQDQAGAAAIGNADPFGRSAWNVAPSRLDHQSHPFGLNLPDLVINQLLVGQCGLTPPAVEEADANFFISHILDGGLDRTPVNSGFCPFQGFLPANPLDQLVDGPHGRACLDVVQFGTELADHCGGRLLDCCGQKLFEKVIGFFLLKFLLTAIVLWIIRQTLIFLMWQPAKVQGIPATVQGGSVCKIGGTGRLEMRREILGVWRLGTGLQERTRWSHRNPRLAGVPATVQCGHVSPA